MVQRERDNDFTDIIRDAVPDGSGPWRTIGKRIDPAFDSAANTLYHEVRHLNQPDGMTLYDAEYDAFYSAEEWSTQKGLQDLRRLRKTDEHGNEVVNPAAVDRLFREAYLGASLDSPLPTEKIVGFDVDPAMTIWENLLTGVRDTRASQEGEYMQGTESTVEGKRIIPKSEFTCDG